MSQGLLVFKSPGLLRVSDTIFAGTEISSGYLGPKVIRGDQGDIVIQRTCFVGNNDQIASVVTDRTGSQPTLTDTFFQRRSSFLPWTDCEFVGAVTSGALALSHIDDLKFACSGKSSTVCEATSLDKFASKLPCEAVLDDINESERRAVQASGVVRKYILCVSTCFVDLSI